MSNRRNQTRDPQTPDTPSAADQLAAAPEQEMPATAGAITVESRDENAAVEPTPTDDATTDPEPTIDPLVVFNDTYTAALDAADPATGTIPGAMADALRTAYRAIRSKRAEHAQSATTDFMSEALDAGDIARLSAVRAASQILAAANEKTTREPKAVVDPVAQALAQVTALRAVESWVLALLPESDRDSVIAEAAAVMNGERPDYIVSWETAGLPTGRGKRGGTKTPRDPNAPRATGRDLKALIMEAMAAANGGPMTAAMLNAATASKGGAVNNACVKLVTAGVLVPTTVKKNDRDVQAWKLAA